MNDTSIFRRWTRPLYVGLVLLLLAAMSISLSGPRLDAASANMAIQAAVPFHLVQQIAAGKAKAVWGKGALGEAIPVTDLRGDLVAWMFSYRIGATEFPAYSEILQEVKKGRALKDHVEHSRLSEARQLHKQLLASELRRGIVSPSPASPTRELGQIEPLRSDGSPSRRAQLGEVDQMLKHAADKAVGAGEFGTVVVSATYRKVPVPVYMYSLAPYYAHFDQALEKARPLIGEGAALKRIYFLGMRGQYFEFVNEASSVVLNAQTLEPTDLKIRQRLQASELSKREADPGASERIKLLWADIQRKTGNR